MITYVIKAALGASILAGGLSLGSAAHATADGPDFYQVRGVKNWDALNIRRWPHHTSRIVGIIPPKGRRVRNLVRRVRGWCLVRYRGTKGWSKCRYLEEQGTVHGATYRVRGVSYDDVLYMRRWPSPRSRIVKALAADARNVVLIRRKGRWGKVMFRGRIGWVHMRYLRPWRG